jgi:predicted membrane chloride channel (bestrophin family)
MIGTIFALTFMLGFMLAIAVTDGLLALEAARSEIEESFGHDSKIFPDHEPD